MFQKLSDSWALVKASAQVLSQDRELLLLPVLSFLATALVLASFLLPVFAFKGLFLDGQNTPMMWLLGFLFYFTQYFVIFFFNAALVGAAQMRFRGLDPTLADAFAAARSVIVPLLGYAAIAATVGMILRAIQEKSGFIGRLVVGLMGMGWTLATFLVVPVLVQRQMGPIEAITESTRLLKKTWGENIAGNVGMGAAFGLAMFVVMALGMGLTLALAGVSMTLAVIVMALSVLALLGLAIYQAALGGVYQAALYRYADTGRLPDGFSQDLVDAAFLPK